MTGTADVGANIASVRARVAEAARRAGRSPEEITIVAASKQVPTARIRQAMAHGLTCFGENYVQEAVAKMNELGYAIPPPDGTQPAVAAGGPPAWHLIGSLQRNKVRHVVGRFALIHSVDSLELGREVGRRASALGIVVPVLIEVNLGAEESKSGVSPEEAIPLAEQLAGVPGVSVQGLMGMPPYCPDPERSRPYFATLKSIFDGLDNQFRRFLSMGMTMDFEQAIEEGANIVRVGTGIFGPRQK